MFSDSSQFVIFDADNSDEFCVISMNLYESNKNTVDEGFFSNFSREKTISLSQLNYYSGDKKKPKTVTITANVIIIAAFRLPHFKMRDERVGSTQKIIF